MRSKVGEGASETGPAPGLRQLDNRIRRKTGKNALLTMIKIIFIEKNQSHAQKGPFCNAAMLRERFAEQLVDTRSETSRESLLVTFSGGGARGA